MAKKRRKGIFDIFRDKAKELADDIQTDLNDVVAKQIEKQQQTEASTANTENEKPKKKKRKGIFDVFRDKVEEVIDEVEQSTDAAREAQAEAKKYEAIFPENRPADYQEEAIYPQNQPEEAIYPQNQPADYVDPTLPAPETVTINVPSNKAEDNMTLSLDDLEKEVEPDFIELPDLKEKKPPRPMPKVPPTKPQPKPNVYVQKGRSGKKGKGKPTPNSTTNPRVIRVQAPKHRGGKSKHLQKFERQKLRKEYEQLSAEERAQKREEFLQKYLELGGNPQSIRKGMIWREQFEKASDEEKIELLKAKFTDQQAKLRKRHQKIRETLVKRHGQIEHQLAQRFQQRIAALQQQIAQHNDQKQRGENYDDIDF